MPEAAAKDQKHLRPRNEVKKIYLPGSPGHERKRLRMTLTSIKRQIAEQGGRREFRLMGLIA